MIPMFVLMVLIGLIPAQAQETDTAVPCGFWADLTQEARNDAIAWEAVRAFTAVRGGYSKSFVKEVLERASDGAASLPPYTYDYKTLFAEVPLRDVRPGHIYQLLEPQKRSAIVVDIGDGWIEMIGSHLTADKSDRFLVRNEELPEQSAFFEIGTGMCEK